MNQTGLLVNYRLPGPVRTVKTVTSWTAQGSKKSISRSKLPGTYVHICRYKGP